jgi:preprotein translocase subunit SecD
MIVCLALGAAASQGCDVVAARLDDNAPHVRTMLALDANQLQRERPETLADARGGRGRISGARTHEETQELALLLRAGALPAPLRIVEQRTVGAR